MMGEIQRTARGYIQHTTKGPVEVVWREYNWQFVGSNQKRAKVVCPFCQTEVIAYTWSMSGSGKKCPKCGAIHRWVGKYSERRVKVSG